MSGLPTASRGVEATLRQATALEIDQRNALTAPVWGNRLGPDQYFERERRLRATGFSRRGMRTWVLAEEVLSPSDAKGGRILASCESYAMNSVFVGALGRTEGVASVFVEEALRGRGYAAAMLSKLREVFESEGAQASILFSEVGTRIYRQVGYQERPIRARFWTPSAGDPLEVAEPLTRRSAAATLERLISSDASGRPRFQIVPDVEQIDWHRERASLYREFLDPRKRDPDELAGAVAGHAWALWTPDYRADRLMVLTARPGEPEENEVLVEALRRAAHALGLPLAELWESPGITLPGGETGPREDEIPMILPLAPGLVPEDWIDYGRGCWV